MTFLCYKSFECVIFLYNGLYRLSILYSIVRFSVESSLVLLVPYYKLKPRHRWPTLIEGISVDDTALILIRVRDEGVGRSTSPQ